MFQRSSLILIAVTATILLLAVTSPEAQPAKIQMEPNLVAINATYNGTEVTVSGEIPMDAEAVVRIAGEKQESQLVKKRPGIRNIMNEHRNDHF